MTELLFQTDSYLQEFEATVSALKADEGVVALDRTAFYPGGGGQLFTGLERLADNGAGSIGL